MVRIVGLLSLCYVVEPVVKASPMNFANETVETK